MANTFSPKKLTLAGMVISVSSVQSLKPSSIMSVMPSGNVMDLRLVQPSNVFCVIEISWLGRFTSVNPVQFWKIP